MVCVVIFVTNKKPRGKRAKTRHLFKNSRRPTVNSMLAKFDVGSLVVINVNSSFHAGMVFRRFQGVSGRVEGKQGDAYIVGVRQGNSVKSVIVNSVHLQAISGSKGDSS